MTEWPYSRNARLFNIWKSANIIYHINRSKNKKILDCVNQWRKSIWQISTPVHGKNSQKNKNRREFTNLINCIYKNPSANIIFNGERWNAFPLRLVTTQGCLLSPLLFNIGGRPSQCNKARKGIKDIHIRKELTLPLFADVKNPKGSIKTPRTKWVQQASQNTK